MTDKPPVDDRVRQLLVHPVVWPDLVAWLDRRGIDVGLMPAAGEDGLPTYVMTPSDALFAAQPAPRSTEPWQAPQRAHLDAANTRPLPSEGH